MESNFIEENPTLFIILFVGICIIFLLGFIVYSLKRRKDKKALLNDNPNLVEIVFDARVAPGSKMRPMSRHYGHILYTINGDEPNIFRDKVYVSTGEVVLDVQYSVSNKSMGSTHTNLFPREFFTFTVEKGKKYKITYNLLDKKYELK
ncbi:MAG: hypothetical protein ACK5LC_12475 [Coprobacillaceae bacterium]